ncbi:MAG: hypothetical protein HOQ09_10815 [Gemmatimonadaceae bacterium]|nr:hypothetical protein [Gemmatimonadaceae bacterium]
MRNARVIVLVALLAAAGVFAYRQFFRKAESPFAIGFARPGATYAELDAKLSEADRTDRTCTPIASGYQICRGLMNAPKGDLTVVVDDRGRITIVDQHVAELSDSTKKLTADLLAGWNDRSAGVPVRHSGAPDATRWLSDDNDWSATMTMKRGATSMSEVVLTDEHALATMNDKTLPALLVLSREGIVGASAIDAAERRAPGSLARAAQKLAAAGAPLATAAAKLPSCGPQNALGIDPGMARRAALGDRASELLTVAMARMYPDRRLELRDSVYLVDATGVPELIDVTAPVAVANGAAYAFAVNYVGRATTVAQSTQTFDAPSCRAPAEIVIAHLDRSRTKIESIERFDADDESLASRVVEMRLGGDARSPRLTVHTLATYGAPDWYGEVDWVGTVDLDSHRVVDRRPTTLAKMDSRSRVAAVDLQSLAAPGAAPSLAGRRVTAIVQANGGSSAQPIVLPSGAGGQPSGWSMLTIL